MRVSKNRGVNMSPGNTDLCQPPGEIARPESGIEQQAETVHFDEAGVAAATTGQDRES